jgi:diketogulonate reductase-like aldo/keto reductase
MTHKPLGQTGVLLPDIGLGTWNYQGGPEPLRRGLDAGALFIDTAESYGSEVVVREAIAGQRERVFLATKVSRSNLRRDAVLQAAEGSLRRLRTDRIDLYQIHEPNKEIPIEETIGAMKELVLAGKVRFVGVSNFSVEELQQAQKAMGTLPIVSNQVRYNLADRTIESGLLSYCQVNHITVIAYSPLGRELQRVRDCDPQGILQVVAREAGKTVPQVVLNWCLCHDAVVAIPKGSTVEHVLQNCGASGWRLTPEQLQRLNHGLKFRRRTALEQTLRRLVPRRLGPIIKACTRMLPRGLRRRVS